MQVMLESDEIAEIVDLSIENALAPIRVENRRLWALVGQLQSDIDEQKKRNLSLSEIVDGIKIPEQKSYDSEIEHVSQRISDYALLQDLIGLREQTIDVIKGLRDEIDAVKEIRAIPGENGKDGEKGVNGRDGQDGQSFTIDDARPFIVSEVERMVSSIPIPQNGKDGTPGKDGIGLASAMIDRNGELIVTTTNGETKGLGIVVGRDGRDGIDGKDGAPGLDGKDGAPGLDGKDGAPGVDGLPGLDGKDGDPGEKGDQGNKGEPGDKGEQGDPGISGEKGERGEPGEVGPQGDPGEKGVPGEKGELGNKGDRGETGIPGDKGDQGDKGDPGDKGDVGDPGEPGEPGQQGDKGDRGDPGEQGEPGQQGDKGDQGDPGEKGDSGEPGEPGEPGLPGTPGEKGDRGNVGEKGDRGEDGIGLSDVEIDKEGQLSVTYTNGLTDTLGTVVGRNGVDGKTPEIDTEQIRSMYSLDMDKRFGNLYEEFGSKINNLTSDIKLLHENTKQNLEETDIHNIINPIRIDLEKQIASGLDGIKNIVAKIQEREKVVVVEKETNVEDIPDNVAEKVAQASRVLAESINLPQPQPANQPIVVNVPSAPTLPALAKSKRIITRRDENGNLVSEVIET